MTVATSNPIKLGMIGLGRLETIIVRQLMQGEVLFSICKGFGASDARKA